MYMKRTTDLENCHCVTTNEFFIQADQYLLISKYGFSPLPSDSKDFEVELIR